eukprot:747649-Hanusia_phi.AAC.3
METTQLNETKVLLSLRKQNVSWLSGNVSQKIEQLQEKKYLLDSINIEHDSLHEKIMEVQKQNAQMTEKASKGEVPKNLEEIKELTDEINEMVSSSSPRPSPSLSSPAPLSHPSQPFLFALTLCSSKFRLVVHPSQSFPGNSLQGPSKPAGESVGGYGTGCFCCSLYASQRFPAQRYDHPREAARGEEGDPKAPAGVELKSVEGARDQGQDSPPGGLRSSECCNLVNLVWSPSSHTVMQALLLEAAGRQHEVEERARRVNNGGERGRGRREEGRFF